MTKGDPLLVRYKDSVYDLSDFAHKHPGGLNTLKGLHQQDMQERFEKAPGHSDAAKYLMKEYKVCDKNNNNVVNGKPTGGHMNGFKNGINGTKHTNGAIPQTTDDSMEVPFDPYRLVFPPVPAVLLATFFYQPVRLLLPYPQLMLAGGLIGYLAYDMIHYYIHYGSPNGGHLYHMKRYHYQHHFVHHDLGFGISSTVWDKIFGTPILLRKLKYLLKW